MPEINSDLLSEFDIIIANLRALLEKIPTGLEDRHGRGNEGGSISPNNQDTFWEIRTRALNLLSGIDSKDENLKQTMEYIRDIEPFRFNIQGMLHGLQKLRSDYESEILTSHPRLPEIPIAMTSQKHKWIKEYAKEIIIGVFIGVASTIIAAWLL